VKNDNPKTMQDKVKTSTIQISLSAICASLAVYMTLAHLVFPFPILPYLRFELAEIPVLVAFFTLGPFMGLTSSMIYWAVLNAFGEWVPIGPAMKLAALAPTIMGLWLGMYLADKILHKQADSLTSIVLSIVLGILFRVITTTLLNFVVLWYLFPSFIEIAASSLKATLGLDLSSEVAKLIWILMFTSLFNVIHFFISFVSSYGIVKSLELTGIPGLKALWIFKLNKPDRFK